MASILKVKALLVRLFLCFVQLLLVCRHAPIGLGQLRHDEVVWHHRYACSSSLSCAMHGRNGEGDMDQSLVRLCACALVSNSSNACTLLSSSNLSLVPSSWQWRPSGKFAMRSVADLAPPREDLTPGMNE